MTGQQRKLSRRSLLLGVSASAVGGGMLGFGAARFSDPTETGAPDRGNIATPEHVPASGIHQAGIARPATPQTRALVVAGDLPMDTIWDTLAALGSRILDLNEGSRPEVLPDTPANLSISVGVGQRILDASPWRELDGFLDMPTYRGDANMDQAHLGGDLLLSINSDNIVDLEPVARDLLEVLPGFTVRWSQLGFRGPGEIGVARNPFGYHDGVIVPRTEEELEENVWIASGPLEHGSVCVLRSFLLDVSAFHELTTPQQDAVIGREKFSGAPLGGTGLHEEANVAAKDPTGEFIIPIDAHVRAAHPSFTGSRLMLRRSYSFSNGPLDGGMLPQLGHMFISFQNDINTFVLTQLRMDESDALMDFITPTTTAAFAMLPGFDRDTPLGASLRP